MSAVTKAIVAKWHGDIAKEHGPVQANRCKALLATMFSKASDAVRSTGRNPCIGVASFAERSRERFLFPPKCRRSFRAWRQRGLFGRRSFSPLPFHWRRTG